MSEAPIGSVWARRWDGAIVLVLRHEPRLMLWRECLVLAEGEERGGRARMPGEAGEERSFYLPGGGHSDPDGDQAAESPPSWDRLL